MNSSKRLCIVFSAFVMAYLGEIAINIACGPEPDPYDYYVSYFHNNLVGDEYVPFSFTDMRFLYEESEPESESLINSQEWADYLGEQVSIHDVECVMYRTDPATDSLIQRCLTVKEVVLPDSLIENTYLKGLKRDEPARNYFLFSKELEPYAAVSYQSYWDPDPRDSIDVSRMKQLADRAVQKADEFSPNSFLRLRYAYQAARMYHYSGSYERCVDVYNEYIAPHGDNSAVQGWALALKAGATRRLGESAESAYLFSRVFTASPERRVQAYKNFHYIDVDIHEVLAEAQSSEEEAAIWAIAGFNTASFDAKTLEMVYDLAPRSSLVAVLLTREVNKLESYLSEASMYYDGGRWADYYTRDSVTAGARQYAQEIIKFSQRLAVDRQFPQRALGVLAEAYLHWLLYDDAEAKQVLASLNPGELPERLADQYRIVDLLVMARSIQQSSTIEAEALMPSLHWLDAKRAQEIEKAEEKYGPERHNWQGGMDMRFSRTATNLYQSVLVPHFLQLGDTAMAAILMAKGDGPRTAQPADNQGFWATTSWSTAAFWKEQLQPQALETLGQWAREGTNSPWDALCGDLFDGLISDDYWDLLGTAYLRMHEYTSASRAFKQLSPTFERENPVDWYSREEHVLYPAPFNYMINDYPKAFGHKEFSKAQFAEAMADLQRRIEAGGNDVAECYFQMANGVYQTGAFGNAWQLISYDWSSTDNYIKGNYYYSDDFHDARQAAAWYEKARELSDDKEFKANCTFMLAKCEQKLYGYNTLTDYYSNAYGLGNGPHPFWEFSRRNKYFKELSQDYSDTDFFKTAVYECSYLSDFINDRIVLSY